MVFVASEQSILKFWKKFFAEQFFAGLIFADFQKIAKSAKNRPPRKKPVLQYFLYKTDERKGKKIDVQMETFLTILDFRNKALLL